ncbi:unnamed protein product [Penicillium olsonii]|nr:unnamed protein product [Penicillium olsonii]CAG7926421.1 unnamed protein product [Penicillium olsonii]
MGHVPSGKKIDGNSPRSGTVAGQSEGIDTRPLTHLSAAPSARPSIERQGSGFAGSRYGSPSPLNMGSMSYALPGHPQYDQMQYPPGQGMIYPMSMPYGPNAGMAYGVPYPYPPYAIPPHGPHYQHYGNQPMQNISQHTQYPQGYYSYSNYPVHRTQIHASPVALSRTNEPKPDPRQENDKKTAFLEYDVSKTIVDGSNPMRLAPSQSLPSDNSSPSHSAPSASTTPRGPPRKPKQSGHALWVGNLPPGANVVDLKDHFSQDATHDIESVFLISKSNCAFVNYKSGVACLAALDRFHDSRFQGVRVVCRLRKGFTAPGSGLGVSGSGGTGSILPSREDVAPDVANSDPTSGGEVPELGSAAPATGTHPPPARVVDRYFIVKSLATEDLELSKINGIWATQSHNEAAMNQAYETADYVYLIFSANKSGEYFGYARMMSPISDDDELALEMPSRPDPPAPEDLDVTLTAATSTAPQGRIIDDSARGTIFWEVESNEDDTHSEKSVELDDVEEQTFGKPFRIEWMSTARVPFHRTRGLRNPWNANREIKIARDGTEIEPVVGRKLVQLFHA